MLSDGFYFIYLLFSAALLFCVCFSQNDDEGSDFDLPPSWVAPIEISLKGDSFFLFGYIVLFAPNTK